MFTALLTVPTGWMETGHLRCLLELAAAAETFDVEKIVGADTGEMPGSVNRGPDERELYANYERAFFNTSVNSCSCWDTWVYFFFFGLLPTLFSATFIASAFRVIFFFAF